MKKVIPFSPRQDTQPASAAAPASMNAFPERDLHPHGAAADRENGTAQQLLLLQRLVGCVDTAELVERFFRWARDLDLADGVGYVNVGLRLEHGQRPHHRAEYDLNLEHHPLGAVTLFRRERFTESELLAIEQALGFLSRCLLAALEFDTLNAIVSQDPLTGLGNRKSLNEWLSREVARCRRHDTPLALLMIDLDHFKFFNDTLGHLGGDHILSTVARTFKRSTRGSDLLFRFGGDEFTILLPHTDLEGAREAAQQIRLALAEIDRAEFGLEDCDIKRRPDVSIGIAAFQAGDDEVSLMQRADTHLYHAKSLGRGQICDAV